MRRAIVFLLLALTYLSGLLPDLAWGDGAIYQRNAVLLNLAPGPLGHPHYILVAHLFTYLPGIPDTTAVTLFSLVSSLLALWVLDRTLEALGAGEVASLGAVVATAVSYVFWLHAEIPEVYAFSTLLTAVAAHGAVRWHLDEAPAWLFASAAALGFSLGVHLLAAVGAVFVVATVVFRPPDRRAALGALAAFALGASPLFVLRLVAPATGAGPFLEAYRLGHVPLGLLLAAASLAYSFPPLAGLFALYGLAAARKNRPVVASATAAAFFFNVLLVAPYAVKDAVVFLHPAAWFFGLATGLGLDRFLRGPKMPRRPGYEGVLLLLFFLVPAIMYAFMPAVARSALAGVPRVPGAGAGGTKPVPVFRVLPGRDDFTYHLFPPKTGASARTYADSAAGVIEAAKGNGSPLVIADWTLLAPLLYLRDVEGRMDSAELVEVPPDRQAARAAGALEAGRPVFVAALDDYYDAEALARLGTLYAAGPIYRLTPRPPEVRP